jgi:PAS domain S-box-containing protein
LADKAETSTPTVEARWLSAVVETAVDGVILIDARGSVLMFNSACEKLFQYRAAEVIDRNVKMLMPETVSRRARWIRGQLQPHRGAKDHRYRP